jgi:Protein of unknown function (DUF2795)
MPNPIDVQKALAGASYPCSKQDLIENAKNNGADDEIVNSLNKLPDGDISGPDQVQKAVF